jgi:hypothetical protein
VHAPPSGTLHISAATSWDAGCTYHALACPRCDAALGKHYYATPPGLAEFAGGYTIDVDKVCVYKHGGWEPAAAVVQSGEVLRLLHPDAEAVAKDLWDIQSVCVGLMESVTELARAVREVAAGLGVDVGKEVERLAGEWEMKGECVLEKLQSLRQDVVALKEAQEKKDREELEGELSGKSVLDKLEALRNDVIALKEAQRKEVSGAQPQGRKRKLDSAEVPFITISPSPSPSAAAVIPDSQPTDGQLSSPEDSQLQLRKKKALPVGDSSEREGLEKNSLRAAANEEEAGRVKRLMNEVAVEIGKAQKQEPEGRKTRTSGKKRR